MLILISFVLLIPFFCIDWALINRINTLDIGSKTTLGMGMLAIIGALAGYFANQIPFSVTKDLIFVGFPIPGAILHLERGMWVDYVVPMPILIFTLNMLNLSLAGASLIWFRVRRITYQRNEA